MTTTGILHPGSMGTAVAAACSGERLWASSGRSEATRERAETAGLTDVGSVRELTLRSDMIISVCPPEVAEAVARDVTTAGFTGIFVDANAVAPATARRIAGSFPRFVDGGLVGPPPCVAGTTRLYLSGPEAGAVLERFEGSPLEALVVPGAVGAASALKMAYAAWTKGSAALLLAIRALAEAEDVAGPLLDEWARSQPELGERCESAASVAAPRAWRWVAEMHEIVATFEAVDLPGGFHGAAADVYRALVGHKDSTGTTVEQVVASLLDRSS